MKGMKNLRLQKGEISRLVIDLPKKRVNVLNEEVLHQIDEVINMLSEEGGVKVLTFESVKRGIYLAGADIGELQQIKEASQARSKSAEGQSLFSRIAEAPFVTVAIIDGVCLGGGLELALACDYRVVTDAPHTRLGLPEVHLGLIPGFGGCYRLARRVGFRKAVELITSGSAGGWGDGV